MAMELHDQNSLIEYAFSRQKIRRVREGLNDCFDRQRRNCARDRRHLSVQGSIGGYTQGSIFESRFSLGRE